MRAHCATAAAPGLHRCPLEVAFCDVVIVQELPGSQHAQLFMRKSCTGGQILSRFDDPLTIVTLKLVTQHTLPIDFTVVLADATA
jgi:hypothetical protein